MRPPVLLLLIVPALAVGCGGDRVGAPSSSTGPARTLTLAFGDDVAAGVAASFAAAAEGASRGSLRIRIRRVPESALVYDLDRGAADIVVAPTYVWEAGDRVPAAAALDAPLVFADDAQLDRAVAGAAGRAVLRGLGAAGVVGLALLPVGLERPISELDVPTDLPAWRTPVGVPRSPPLVAAVRALGGTSHPYERETPPSLEAYVDRIVVGPLSEVTRLAQFAPLDLATLTSNGVLNVVMNTAMGSNVDALAAASRAYVTLTRPQRAALRLAAHETRTHWPSAQSRAAAEVVQACALGAELFDANAGEVVALRRAVATVSDRLGRDPLARAVLRGISATAPRSPSAIGSCPARFVGGSPAPAILDGTYALDATGERSSAGSRLVIAGGRFSASGAPFTPGTARVRVVTGSVTASDRQLTFRDDRVSAVPLTVDWILFDDVLRVSPSPVGPGIAVRSSPPRVWRRIGGPHRVGSEVGTYLYASRYLALAGPGNDYRYGGTTPGATDAVRWLGHYRFDGHILELDPDRSCHTCPTGGEFDWAPDDAGGGAMILWPRAGTSAVSYWATPIWTPAG